MLRAGPMTLKFADGELRYLHAGGREIVHLITEHRFAPSPEIIDFGAQSRAVKKSAE